MEGYQYIDSYPSPNRAIRGSIEGNGPMTFHSGSATNDRFSHVVIPLRFISMCLLRRCNCKGGSFEMFLEGQMAFMVGSNCLKKSILSMQRHRHDAKTPHRLGGGAKSCFQSLWQGPAAIVFQLTPLDQPMANYEVFTSHNLKIPD